MKIGITLKLFLAFFVTFIIVIVTMATAVRYSFQSGFLDYINKVELERLDALAETIAEEYEQHDGDWRFIKYKRGIWHRLIISHLRSTKGGLFKPESFQISEEGQSLDLTDLGLRLALLNADKEFVAGNRQFSENAVQKPIVNKGEIIGWLSITPSTALVDTVDIQFTEQQNNAAVLISVLSIFFAAIIAVFIAQNLLRPIKSLVHATRSLTAGNTGTRIDVTDVDEIGQLQKDFNSLAQTLEKNEQTRRQWIADISHELRTPMAVLLGEIAALQDGLRQPTNQNLDSLYSEIIRVNQLIDDLYQLSMSDIGALDYRKEDIEIIEVLEDVVSSFEDQLRENSISVNMQFDDNQRCRIFADEQRLYQLFSNLMQNTLRYTNSSGRCKIDCEQLGDKIIVNWQDSEPGVPEHMLENLFDRLFRAEESRNRNSGGAGLGLSICKNIVEAHDGEISVKHSVLGGLWFQIHFPALNLKSR